MSNLLISLLIFIYYVFLFIDAAVLMAGLVFIAPDEARIALLVLLPNFVGMVLAFHKQLELVTSVFAIRVGLRTVQILHAR